MLGNFKKSWTSSGVASVKVVPLIYFYSGFFPGNLWRKHIFLEETRMQTANVKETNKKMREKSEKQIVY